MKTNTEYRKEYGKTLTMFINDWCAKYQINVYGMHEAVEKWAKTEENVPFTVKDISNKLRDIIIRFCVGKDSDESYQLQLHLERNLSFFDKSAMMQYLFDLETEIRMSAEYGVIKTIHIDSYKYKINKLYDVFFSYDEKNQQIFVDLEFKNENDGYNHIRHHVTTVYLEKEKEK